VRTLTIALTDTIYQSLVGTLSNEESLFEKYQLRLTLNETERNSVLSHFHAKTDDSSSLIHSDAFTTIRTNAARMLVQAEAEHRHILCSEIPVSQAAAVQVRSLRSLPARIIAIS